MADELKIFAAMAFNKGGTAEQLGLPAPLAIDITGTRPIHIRQSIPNGAAEALQLGEVTPAGARYMIVNRDSTNFVTIRSHAGEKGVDVEPGEFTYGKWPGSVTAPVAQADTAAVEIEMLIIPA